MAVLGIVRRQEAKPINYINLKYSATAGLLYVDNPEVSRKMEEIRTAFRDKFGKDAVARFDGEENTKFFCEEMIKRGVIGQLDGGGPDAIGLMGNVTNVQLDQKDADNKLETDYLKVTFEVADPNETQRLVVSLDFTHKLAQNLIPRLLTIQPGQVAYFCPSPFFRADDKERRFPVHGVTLNDENGKPIKRVDGFIDQLKSQQDELLDDIKASGADMEDPDVKAEIKEMLEGQRRAFYLGMFKEVQSRFSPRGVKNTDSSDVADDSNSPDHLNQSAPRP